MDGFSFNFAGDKPRVNEVIPSGTKVLLRLTYTPGGADFPSTPVEQRTGQLTASKEDGSDVLYLKAELTVQRGPYRGRKIFTNMTVAGGKQDEKGRSIAAGITRSQIRSILDSANGLSSKDESPEAAAKRVLPAGFASLQGLTFVAKVGVKPAKGQYQESNTLATVLTVDHKDYPKSEDELDNPPKPAAAAPALPSAPAPAWGAPATQAPAAVASGPAAPAPFVAAQTAPQPALSATPPLAASAAPAQNGGLPGWAK